MRLYRRAGSDSRGGRKPVTGAVSKGAVRAKRTKNRRPTEGSARWGLAADSTGSWAGPQQLAANSTRGQRKPRTQNPLPKAAPPPPGVCSKTDTAGGSSFVCPWRPHGPPFSRLEEQAIRLAVQLQVKTGFWFAKTGFVYDRARASRGRDTGPGPWRTEPATQWGESPATGAGVSYTGQFDYICQRTDD
jgi:hypothetical protein